MDQLEALALPNAPVIRVVKEALDSQVIISKDLKANLSLCSTLFTLHITTMYSLHSAHAIAKEAQGKKKTLVIKPEHILQALEEMEFETIAAQLEERMHKRVAGQGHN